MMIIEVGAAKDPEIIIASLEPIAHLPYPDMTLDLQGNLNSNYINNMYNVKAITPIVPSLDLMVATNTQKNIMVLFLLLQ